MQKEKFLSKKWWEFSRRATPAANLNQPKNPVDESNLMALHASFVAGAFTVFDMMVKCSNPKDEAAAQAITDLGLELTEFLAAGMKAIARHKAAELMQHPEPPPPVPPHLLRRTTLKPNPSGENQ